MKRWVLLVITCIVVDQLKAEYGWLTKCKGIEVDGEVVLDKEIKRGQAVQYKPFMLPGDDEYVHGTIRNVGEPVRESPKVEESSDTGKSPG